MEQKIIEFNKDAEFFFNRGYLSFKKGDYLKTLRYFRRMVEMEPQNAVYRFYLAEVLTEIGRYQESNELLQYNVEIIDPSLADCYFAMACNYFALQLFTKAQESLEVYLKQYKQVGYREEALEVMQILQMQDSFFQHEYPHLKKEQIKNFSKIIDKGRYALLLANYRKSIHAFKQVINEFPELIAVKNDLCLAYYNNGQYQEMHDLACDILRQDKDDIDAACFYILSAHALGKIEQALRRKNKIMYLNPEPVESCFVLGWTMGKLGEHERAYQLMKQVKHSAPYLSKVLHFLAIASMHCQRYDEAMGLWYRLQQIEPENPLSSYYIQEVQAIKNKEIEPKFYPYEYELPEEEREMRIKTLEKMFFLSFEEFNGAVEGDDELRKILQWGLLNEKTVIREKALDLICHFPSPVLERMVQRFMLKVGVDDRTKNIMITFLKKIDRTGSYPAYINGHYKKLDVFSKNVCNDTNYQNTLDRVLDLTLEKMAPRYENDFAKEIGSIWAQFLKALQPEMPRITRPVGWAAALEYCFCRLHGLQITQKQLSHVYGVSPSTISQHFQSMNQFIHVGTLEGRQYEKRGNHDS